MAAGANLVPFFHMLLLLHVYIYIYYILLHRCMYKVVLFAHINSENITILCMQYIQKHTSNIVVLVKLVAGSNFRKRRDEASGKSPQTKNDTNV